MHFPRLARAKVSGIDGRLTAVSDCMFEGLLQPMHLVLILAIAAVLFGPKRLPELGRGLGEAIRGFREGLATHEAEAKSDETKALPPK